MVGGTGTVLVPLPGGPSPEAWGVARQPDGKLVVVGSVGEDSTPGHSSSLASIPTLARCRLRQRRCRDHDLGAVALRGGLGRGGPARRATRRRGLRAIRPIRLVPYATRSTELVVLRYGPRGARSRICVGRCPHVPSQSFESYFFVRGLGLARDGTIFVRGQRGLTYLAGLERRRHRPRARRWLARQIVVCRRRGGPAGDVRRPRPAHLPRRDSPRVPGVIYRDVGGCRRVTISSSIPASAPGFARADFP